MRGEVAALRSLEARTPAGYDVRCETVPRRRSRPSLAYHAAGTCGSGRRATRRKRRREDISGPAEYGSAWAIGREPADWPGVNDMAKSALIGLMDLP
jgi:hypothetical protein